MKTIILKFLTVFILFYVCINSVEAADISKADNLMKKADRTSVSDEKYEYIINARKIYQEECDENPLNIAALLGLSKTYQYTKNRNEAKLYVLKAYNLNPASAHLQKEMGDFYYNFQEYSTAIEYYKLSLASGNLKDFETNLQSAKCYEKLGDTKSAQLYYQICNMVNPKSRKVLNKLNEYDSKEHIKKTKQKRNKEKKINEFEYKYMYLYKDVPKSETEQTEEDAQEIIERINNI